MTVYFAAKYKNSIIVFPEIHIIYVINRDIVEVIFYYLIETNSLLAVGKKER